MKTYILLLTCVLIIFFSSCRDIGKLADEQKSGSYFIDSKGQIAYCQNGNWFSLGVLPMEADPESFEVLAEDIAKDKGAVYYRNMKQKLVDRNSFYVENQVPKDRFHVYAIDQVLGFNIIKGADPKTYELVDSHVNWARDKDHYFYADDMVHADRQTFTFVNNYFLKDKDSVYVSPNIGDFRSISTNPGNVDAINAYYIRIGSTIYYPPFQKDSHALAQSFDIIRALRILDQDILIVNDKSILVRGKIFKYNNVDAHSFQLFPVDQKYGVEISNYYSKDKHNIYYNQEIIPAADVKTFIPIGDDFGKDAKNAYYQKQMLRGVDVKSFKKDGEFYKDKLGNKFSAVTGNKV